MAPLQTRWRRRLPLQKASPSLQNLHYLPNSFAEVKTTDVAQADVKEGAGDAAEDPSTRWFVVTAGKQISVFAGW
jgi:hypothetical protein